MNDATTIIESKLKSGTVNSYSTEFNGTTESATVNNDIALQPGLLDFSFIARFTQQTLTNDGLIFGFDAGGYSFAFVWIDGRPFFIFDDTINSFTTTGGAQFMALDEFFTLGFSCDRDGNIKSFIDGTQYISESFAGAAAYDMTFNNNITIGDGIDGLIDEVILWKGAAMSDNEMETLLYNNGHAIEPKQKKFYDIGPEQIKKTVSTDRGGYLAAHYKMGDGDTAPFIVDHVTGDLYATMQNMDQSNFKNLSSP